MPQTSLAPRAERRDRSAPQQFDLRQLATKTSAVALAHTRTLGVPDALSSLFPDGGLRRGSVMHCDSMAVTLSLMAKVSSEGNWCAVLNQPDVSFLSIPELGGVLERCVRVSVSDSSWISAAASLLDGCALVVGSPPSSLRAHHARQLTARVQERDGVLMVSSLDNWALAPFISLTVDEQKWTGAEQGHGYLRSREMSVRANGRGAASRERRVTVAVSGDGIARCSRVRPLDEAGSDPLAGSRPVAEPHLMEAG